jgi:UDP-N-acetyl-D-galactosamine dehydrogenase
VVAELRDYGVQVDVHDPWADTDEARHEYGLDLIGAPEAGAYDGIVLAVAHDAFHAAGPGALRSYGREGAVLCDLKSVFARNESDLFNIRKNHDWHIHPTAIVAGRKCRSKIDEFS